MRYTVVYDPAAENELMRIWMGAPDPHAVELASNDIDRQLKRAPDRSGVTIGAYRRLIVYPLAVEFTVSSPDRMVRVFRVEFLP
jgi:hypothetical protein